MKAEYIIFDKKLFSKKKKNIMFYFMKKQNILIISFCQKIFSKKTPQNNVLFYEKAEYNYNFRQKLLFKKKKKFYFGKLHFIIFDLKFVFLIFFPYLYGSTIRPLPPTIPISNRVLVIRPYIIPQGPSLKKVTD